MKTLLFVWNYRNWGGAQVYNFDQIRAIDGKHDMAIVLPDGSDDLLIREIGSLQIPVYFIPGQFDMMNDPSWFGRIRRRIWKFRSEWVLVNFLRANFNLKKCVVQIDIGFWTSLILLVRLSLLTDVIAVVHTALPRVSELRRLIWRVKGSIISRFRNFHTAVSNREALESMDRYLKYKHREDIVLGYSGVNIEAINCEKEQWPDRKQICLQFGFTEGSPLLVTVGQFIPRKGCWVLLDALSRLASDGVDFQSVWISPAELGAEANRKVSAFGLGSRFTTITTSDLGEVRRGYLALINVADIFILPSLEEGLPLVLLDAMALGKPCIASIVNAVPEAVENEISGMLIESNSPKALSEAIRQLLVDPARRNTLGINARIRAEKDFNTATTCAPMLRLYESLLN